MSFRFKKGSCVVAGTFNMYIVQPPWLTKIGIFPKGTKVAIWSKFNEPGFRFQPEELLSRWFVTPNQIEVETDKPEEDCGSKVAMVLSKLPWTPLSAIGNNTVYEAPLSELEALHDFGDFTPMTPAGFEVVQKSFHVCLAHGDQQYNFQFSITRELIELSVNVNTDLTGKESEFSQQVARAFLDHRKQAEQIIQESLKARLEDASTHERQA